MISRFLLICLLVVDLPIYAQTPPRFQDIKAQVFDVSCNGCHNPQNRIRFPNYDLTIRFLESIATEVFAKQSMPPKATPLSESQKTLLAEWIQAGAPDDSGKPAGLSPLPPTLAPTFQSIKYHVFDLKCTPCHQAEKVNHRVPLEDYGLAVNSEKKWVVPGDLKSSRLMNILDLPMYDTSSMPPPNSPAPHLRPWELLLIRQWIETGAPEH